MKYRRRTQADDAPIAMTPPSNVGKQAARFAAAGVLNTGIDYVCFLLLTSILQLPLQRSWIAKAISGSLAMANSFVLNRKWVFRGSAGGARQVARFVAVTLVGTFVVQLGGTHLLSAVWPAPGALAFRIATAVGIPRLAPTIFTEPMVIRTVAFGLSTAASMCWNFFAYRRWVFAPAPPAPRVPAGAAVAAPSH
jgi:putative flippase GtrA